MKELTLIEIKALIKELKIRLKEEEKKCNESIKMSEEEIEYEEGEENMDPDNLKDYGYELGRIEMIQDILGTLRTIS